MNIKESGQIQFKLLSVLMIVLLVFLQYKLWFGAGGIKDRAVLKKQYAAQTEINNALKKKNDALLHQVHYLQQNQDAIESRARQELGMIKKDETFYQVMK